ncbi:MAG: hypothetical protein WBH86_13350 [Thermogutta sp.]|nr:hypothetical protein [Thermogutta sp.]HOP77994.1 hypothetical protein [Thermogutta sp.]HPU07089.1 hypothetical protein [Thermogutta sp.]HQF13890.1 hypothetical protein [Thermogutta sp.]
MKNTERDGQINAGYDSFLDTVTNIVGILIILVMVVGVRAQHLPFTLKPDTSHAESAEEQARRARAEELARRSTALLSLRRDILELSATVEMVEAERLARERERQRLALAAALLKKELDEKTVALSQEERRREQLAEAIAACERDIAASQQRLAELSSTTEQVQIVNHPTPLSVPVDFEEIHFVIRQGKIAYIPLSSLLDELMSDARRKIPRLFEVPEITGTVGPVGGFKLEYSIVRRTIGEAEIAGVPGAGAYAQLRRWILIPEGNVGEPVAQALEESSEFRRRIAGYRPDRTTVTIWCYPDGFADFRRLKDFLHERGYSVAGRPLPDGFPITGSPGGTKSSAQ